MFPQNLVSCIYLKRNELRLWLFLSMIHLSNSVTLLHLSPVDHLINHLINHTIGDTGTPFLLT